VLRILKAPLPAFLVAPAAGALVLVTSLYCVAYTHLAGRPETVGEAATWGVVNVLPWFLGFEVAKRASTWGPRWAVLGIALLASLLVQPAPSPGGGALLFELLRRLPALALVAALLALPSLPQAPRRRGRAQPALRIDHCSIEWVSAAGNYVELHAGGRSIVERASLSALETHLAPFGFVRIHRSLLVRRDRIARIRRHDLILADGTVLKTGKRYRSLLPPA
jgi:hypothetical protein